MLPAWHHGSDQQELKNNLKRDVPKMPSCSVQDDESFHEVTALSCKHGGVFVA